VPTNADFAAIQYLHHAPPASLLLVKHDSESIPQSHRHATLYPRLSSLPFPREFSNLHLSSHVPFAIEKWSHYRPWTFAIVQEFHFGPKHC
jgi:hypothetical protein